MFVKHMKLQILTALLIVVSANATHHAMKANVWKAQCELATQLRKTPGQAKAKLNHLIESLKNLNMMKLKLQVYAAANPRSEYKDAAAVLAAQAEKPRAAALSGAEYAIDTGLRATAITADLAAALATPIMTIASAGGRSNYCLNSKGANKDTGSGKPEIAAAGCKELELDTLVTTDGMDAAAISAEGFPMHTAVTGAAGKGEASQCGMFTTTSNPTSSEGIKIGAGSDKFKMGYGTITVAADDKPNAPDLTKLNQGGDYGTLDIFKRAHKVSLELRQTPSPKDLTKGKELLKELAEQPSIISLTQDHLAATSPGKKASQLTSEATTAKTNYFCDNNNKLEAMWSDIEGTQVKGSKDDTNKQQQIKALGDADTLERVLAYYTAANKRAFLALEKENKKIKEATGSTGKAGGNCKKHNTSAECAGEKGCDFDGGKPDGQKCFPKDDKGDEKDGEREKTPPDCKTNRKTITLAIANGKEESAMILVFL